MKKLKALCFFIIVIALGANVDFNTLERNIFFLASSFYIALDVRDN